jgi:GH35 family endo-1,4-beta-xylanase
MLLLVNVTALLGVELPSDYSGKDIKGIESLVKEVKAAREDWRKEANKRIDKHRKSDLIISVVGPDGKPAAGAEVKVKLTKHAFEYGTAISRRHFLGEQGVDPDIYKEAIKAFTVKIGFNNGLKYKLTAKPEKHKNIPPIIEWSKAQGIPVRGHCLIWPGGLHMPKELQVMVYGDVKIPKRGKKPDYKDLSKAELKELREYCENMVTVWAKKWDVTDWDVINETRGNHAIQDILGREVMVDWFKLADKHQVNKGGGLYLNENRVISCPQKQAEKHLKLFYDEVDFLVQNGAPITGLGFQTRMKEDTPAEEIYRRLEMMAEFGIPMAATEHEVSPTKAYDLDEELRARITERVLTVYFSHPLVVQFIHWTFFSKANEETGTSADQGLLWKDGTIKLNGKIWQYLWKQHWITDETVKTDSKGKVKVRGYLGKHSIAVNHKGNKKSGYIILPKKGKKITIKLK